MTYLLWIFAGIMIVILSAMGIKIYSMQKAAREIISQFHEKLTMDTNTLITVSCRDRHMRRLAADINGQLRRLRAGQLRFRQGNLELMDAVTSISHDLRTPLTAICGYLDLLRQTENPEDIRRYLAVIEERTNSLKQLTEELFRYFAATSSIDEVPLTEVNINGVLEETVSSYYAALKGCGIAPQIVMPEKKVIRSLDKTALSRIFANLIGNAIKYSDGDLTISLSEDGEILFSNHASGLNELQAMQLLNRYYTVESAGKSTGLGLSIAKELTEKMNGKIAVRFLDGILSISILFPTALR